MMIEAPGKRMMVPGSQLYFNIKKSILISAPGWAPWLTPVFLVLWEPEVVESGDQEFETNQPGQYGETPSLLKIQKIRQMWWHAPRVPATWKAEAEESLELRRQRLQ